MESGRSDRGKKEVKRLARVGDTEGRGGERRRVGAERERGGDSCHFVIRSSIAQKRNYHRTQACVPVRVYGQQVVWRG